MPMKLACRTQQLHDAVLVAAQMRLCTNARGTVVPVGKCLVMPVFVCAYSSVYKNM